MYTSFKQYMIEEEKTVFFTFGGMNPPTAGHGKLLDKLCESAGKNPYRVYLSQTNDNVHNPLMYETKIKAARKMFPKHARQIMVNRGVKNPSDVLATLHNEGFRKVVMVVGENRVIEFDTRLNKHNGKERREGFYNFEKILVESAGIVDPDSKETDGVSPSMMREFAADNNFARFGQCVPSSSSNADTRRLFNDVRAGLGLNEEKTFKRHIELAPISDLREAYVNDRLFELGERVVINQTGVVGDIEVLGSNYLIVESKGERYRCWLEGVSKLDPNSQPTWDTTDFKSDADDGVIREANQPEWGTPESTAKAKKVTPGEQAEGSRPGLWDNIRARRAKGLPKKKPGEKGYPKTLNIEGSVPEPKSDAMRSADQAISKDKEASKKKMRLDKEKAKRRHDRILDRARTIAVRKANRQSTGETQ